MEEPKNSLKNIKKWLDIPYLKKIAKTEKRLDAIIIAGGFSENDVSEIGGTYIDVNMIPVKPYHEISWSNSTWKYSTDGNRIEVIEHHTTTAIPRPINIIRSIINKMNKDLAIYGYTVYKCGSDDMYVRYNEYYSLYVPILAYIKKDYAAINESIFNGLKNTIDCTKANEDKAVEIFKEVIESHLYRNILKLKTTEKYNGENN